jgi:hypothetical protein
MVLSTEAHADIGGVDVRDPVHKETLPEVDTQALCEQAQDEIEGGTVTRSHLSFLPPWFLDNALSKSWTTGPRLSRQAHGRLSPTSTRQTS